MKKNRLKVAVTFAACLLLSGATAIDIQAKAQLVKESEAETSTNTEKAEQEELKAPIAIVNLDEGISSGEEQQNYGSTLIQTLKETVKVTGLEDARQGIETGAYSAYIIIPNTFSEKAAKLDTRPEKSTLTYALGTAIDPLEREKVLERVVNIYNTFSAGLSQVYTSSLLKEYHDVQDAADEIMKRDTLDMDTLLAVNGYDLMEIIETPELKTVEQNISSLDLSDNYAANRTGVAALDSSYKKFLQDGKNSFAVVQGDAGELQKKAAETGKKLNSTAAAAAGISVTERSDKSRSEQENQTYEQQRTKVTGEAGILDQYNQTLDTYNTAVVHQSGMFGYVQKQYDDFQKSLDSAGLVADISSDQTDQTEIDGQNVDIPVNRTKYQFFKVEDVEQVIDTFAEELERIDELLASSETEETEEPETEESEASESSEGEPLTIPEPETSGGLTSVLPEGYTGSYEDYVRGLLAAVNIDTQSPREVTATAPQEMVTAPTVTIGEDELQRMPEVDEQAVDEEIGAIISTAKTGRKERNKEYTDLAGEYSKNVTSLQGKVNGVQTAYSEQTAEQDKVTAGVSGFDLTSYVNEEEVSTQLETLQKNNQAIEEKVRTNNSEHETYAENVYKATNENISAMQKNIEVGQKASQEKLEKGLAAAKESREESNQKNVSALKDFSSRLSYTRLGELENREVYGFIAQPILLENRSLEPSPNTSVAPVAQKADTGITKPLRETAAQVNRLPGWILWLAAALVGITLTGFGVYRLIRKKSGEEF